MLRLITAYVLVSCFPLCVYGGKLHGTISTAEELKESQSAVVVWVEGLKDDEAKSQSRIISQAGLQFLPRVLAVSVGQTVQFPNEDDVSHNVFSLSEAKKFKLGIYPKGESRDVTFEKTGIIDLFCSIHRHMHAVIVVTPSSHYCQTELGNGYEIDNIPSGKHTLKIWNSKLKVITKEFEMPASGTLELNLSL